jgi:hypothetical protein
MKSNKNTAWVLTKTVILNRKNVLNHDFNIVYCFFCWWSSTFIVENELNSFCTNNFKLSFSQELKRRTGCHEIAFVKQKIEIDWA